MIEKELSFSIDCIVNPYASSFDLLDYMLAAELALILVIFSLIDLVLILVIGREWVFLSFFLTFKI